MLLSNAEPIVWESVSTAHPLKIIGSDDRVSPGPGGERLPERLRPILPAFGALRFVNGRWASGAEAPYCTATHIGQGRVLTAGHCVGAETLPPGDVLSGAPCADIVLDWNYVQGSRPVRARCTEITYAAVDASRGVDFALLKVDVIPKVTLSLASSPVAPSRQATLLGFPLGKSLMWSPRCFVVEPTPVVPPRMLAHTCDTEPGQSGAALLDDATLRIIGVHAGGYPGMNYAMPSSLVRQLVPGL